MQANVIHVDSAQHDQRLRPIDERIKEQECCLIYFTLHEAELDQEACEEAKPAFSGTLHARRLLHHFPNHPAVALSPWRLKVLRQNDKHISEVLGLLLSRLEEGVTDVYSKCAPD